MPNIAKILKEEITRIARKETKLGIAPIRKSTIRMKPEVADLKNRLAVLEKEVKRLNLLAINLASTQPAPSLAEVPKDDRAWITGKGIRSLRAKLGLSQGDFGRLVGVSMSSVVQWESKPGMLKFRDATKAAVMAVRGIGKLEARKRLDEMGKAKKAVRGKKVKGGKAKRRK